MTMCVCCLIWHDYTSLVEGESHGILLWSLYLQDSCMGLITMKLGKWKINLYCYEIIFICMLYLTCINEVLCGDTISINMGMVSKCMGLFSIHTGVMCIPAGTICITIGMNSNQILMGDTGLCFFLCTGMNFLPVRINFYCDQNFQPWGKYLPYIHHFLPW